MQLHTAHLKAKKAHLAHNAWGKQQLLSRSVKENSPVHSAVHNTPAASAAGRVLPALACGTTCALSMLARGRGGGEVGSCPGWQGDK